MKEMLEVIDAYKANNYDVTADCYPYYAFSTRIGETTYDDGFLEKMCIRDRRKRDRLYLGNIHLRRPAQSESQEDDYP